MFGFLKRFGRKSEANPVSNGHATVGLAAHTNGAAPHLNSAAALAEPPVVPAEPLSAFSPAPQAAPRPQPASTSASAPAPVPPRAPQQRPPAPPAPAVPQLTIELPLKQLWHKLNPEVLRLATGHPNGTAVLRVPFPLMHAQLSKGAVRIPYVQLRQFAPEGLFPALPDKDSQEVDIPISEILPHLRPEHLARRPNQRKIEVPDEIEPVFGPNSGSAGNLRVLDSAPSAQRPAGIPSPRSPLPIPPAPAKTPPPPPAPAPTPVAPVATAPNLAPALPIPPPPAAIPAPRSPLPTPRVPLSSASAPALEGEIKIPAPRLDPSLATLRPKAPEARFIVASADLASSWIEKGRDDLEALHPHSLEIPMSTLETALKSGKLQFLWSEVRPWLKLAADTSMPELPEDTTIELPLAVIAPRFIEQRGRAKPARKVEVSDEIPDVFEVRKANAPAVAPEAGVTPPSEPNTAFLTKALNGRPYLEFGEIFGQPEKKDWTMSEVAQKTLGLRGVAGAVVATSDGLLVAGTWTGEAKSDSVAAFVPQLYNRMLQYTRELKLGEPGNFTLTIENTPLQIFKTGTSYLTVLGRPGETLPKAQLNAVALRLAANSTAN